MDGENQGKRCLSYSVRHLISLWFAQKFSKGDGIFLWWKINVYWPPGYHKLVRGTTERCEALFSFCMHFRFRVPRGCTYMKFWLFSLSTNVSEILATEMTINDAVGYIMVIPLTNYIVLRKTLRQLRLHPLRLWAVWPYIHYVHFYSMLKGLCEEVKWFFRCASEDILSLCYSWYSHTCYVHWIRKFFKAKIYYYLLTNTRYTQNIIFNFLHITTFPGKK